MEIPKQLKKSFLVMRKGKVYLWGVSETFIDAELFHYLDMELIKTFGFKRRSEIIYTVGKKPSLEACRNFTSSPLGWFLKKNVRGRRKIVDFFAWLIDNYGGMGVLDTVKYDEKKMQFIGRVKHSAIAMYFKTNKPVCHYFCATYAAGAEAIFDREFIARETKCEAKGDPYCEVVVEEIK
jgi:predicted hydrocarbon binding protein